MSHINRQIYRNLFNNHKLLCNKKTIASETVSSSNQLNLDAEKIENDYIGLPDKQSNLRPIIRHKNENHTNLQIKLREKNLEVQAWNQNFWTNHNRRFFQEKDDFIAAHKKHSNSNEQLSADKMSEFYKQFLDKNWQMHVLYNISWYMKNFDLLVTSFQVFLQNMYYRIRPK